MGLFVFLSAINGHGLCFFH